MLQTQMHSQKVFLWTVFQIRRAVFCRFVFVGSAGDGCFGGWIHCFSRWRSPVIHILGDRLWNWFVVQCVSRDYWSATAWHTDAVLRSLSTSWPSIQNRSLFISRLFRGRNKAACYWDDSFGVSEKKTTTLIASKSSERDCKINPYELSGLSQLCVKKFDCFIWRKYIIRIFFHI